MARAYKLCRLSFTSRLISCSVCSIDFLLLVTGWESSAGAALELGIGGMCSSIGGLGNCWGDRLAVGLGGLIGLGVDSVLVVGGGRVALVLVGSEIKSLFGCLSIPGPLGSLVTRVRPQEHPILLDQQTLSRYSSLI